MSPTNLPRLMWVDLTVSVRQSELPGRFSKSFDITRPHEGSSLESEIRRQQPDLLLFDYDYPERPGLKLLELTKKDFPSIPIIMMTVQHSESLAIWAFRSRVWDFLVKPVSHADLDRCLTALDKLMADRHRRQQQKREVKARVSPVPEENRVGSRTCVPAELMPAISYIESHYRGKIESAAIAKLCGMDSFRFSRAFKTAFGITFKEYLLRFRIKEACRLLEKPDIAVTDVAILAGFNDPSYFARVFKRYAGVSPSKYASSDEYRGVLESDNLSLNVDHA